jgi:purine-binding chemotaxis protein CheW
MGEQPMSSPQTPDLKQILVFALDEPRFALHLSVVERVVRAVELMPLPKAPAIALGVINMQGQIIPVVNIRMRLHLPMRELELDDRFIIAHTSRRRVALLVDSVSGIRELTDREWAAAEQVVPGAKYIHGVAKLADDLVLICDLEEFLSVDEEQALEASLATGKKKARQKKQGT